MKQHLVGAPFERIGMDILGPLPESYHGNKYVLILCDYFTKWTESYPMPDQEAITIVKVFVREFVSRYSVPNQIHTDQGAQFESKLFQDLCEYLGVDKTSTTPYHPQSDGLVERFNRTLESMLSKLIGDDQRAWDDALPLVMLAYRSSVHETIGETPSRMVFGRQVQLPVDLVLGRPPDQAVTDDIAIPYVNGLRDQLYNTHDLARSKMEEASAYQKRNYDVRMNFKQYNIGDIVLLHDPARKKGVCKKLTSPWIGPFLVVGKVSDLVFKIQRSPTARVKVVHHDRLKLCHGGLESWLVGPAQGDMNVSVPGSSSDASNQVLDVNEDEVVDEFNDPTDFDEFKEESVHDSPAPRRTRSGRDIRKPERFADFELYDICKLSSSCWHDW